MVAQALNDGSSHFHALDARIEKRFSHGFLMLLNFQKSKLLEKRSRLNDLDTTLEKRSAAEDRPYRLVWSGTYDLPFGRGKAVLKDANRAINLIVGRLEHQPDHDLHHRHFVGLGEPDLSGRRPESRPT